MPAPAQPMKPCNCGSHEDRWSPGLLQAQCPVIILWHRLLFYSPYSSGMHAVPITTKICLGQWSEPLLSLTACEPHTLVAATPTRLPNLQLSIGKSPTDITETQNLCRLSMPASHFPLRSFLLSLLLNQPVVAFLPDLTFLPRSFS